jgi:hypothetical protein
MVLLIALLVIGGVTWLAIAQPWNGGSDDPEPAAQEETTAPSPDPSDEPSPTPTPSATPEGPQECDPEVLEVAAITDQGEYPAGELPQFSIQLDNTGDVACTLNVGTTTQSLTVTSGEDVWWRSTDCQSEPSDMEVTLEAGQSVTSAEPVTWDRTRSTAETCDSESRPAAPGGGALYRLSVSIAGVDSSEQAEFLLH